MLSVSLGPLANFQQLKLKAWQHFSGPQALGKRGKELSPQLASHVPVPQQTPENDQRGFSARATEIDLKDLRAEKDPKVDQQAEFLHNASDAYFLGIQ